jgi:hypothetical protein
MAQSVRESTVLCSVVIRSDSRFLFPEAIKKDVWRVHLPGAPEPVTMPARPADHWNAWSALQWAVANYGTKFRLPSVSVRDVTAKEALEELIGIEKGKQGFGKIVFQHPL